MSLYLRIASKEFRRVAAVSGFELLETKPGRWPKLRPTETGVQVDTLPEGATPGIAGNLALTTIPHPKDMGAGRGRLRYMTLPAQTHRLPRARHHRCGSVDPQ